jgi:ABC-type transport system involved in cytochrome c biogenesis permease subunit
MISDVVISDAKRGAKHSDAIASSGDVGRVRFLLPVLLPIIGAILMTLARVQIGGNFISDGALIIVALACYLTAATFLLTNIYAPSTTAARLGSLFTALGVFFNLSSWGVRWIAARDREIEILVRNGHTEFPWFFRYIPFANLYDLSLAFAFGAGLTTLVLARRRNMQFIGALSLPLVSLILLLAIFIGGQISDLQPVLDSYWRPIHVGVASLGYGVALVCFAVAVMYLLKDNVRTEAMGIWSSLFALSVFATVSRFDVFTTGTYSASIFFFNEGQRVTLPVRAAIPYVGLLLVFSGILLAGVIFCFARYLMQQSEAARTWGHRLLKLSLVTQAAAIITLVWQIKNTTNISSRIDQGQFAQFGQWVAKRAYGLPDERIASLNTANLEGFASDFIRDFGSQFALSLNANPVELAALITGFAATLFVIIFSFRTERLRAALPSLERLDSMMYRTASVTFALLCMLLITGAIWANESWGRPWGWDPKETGAFVAALTYAGYLHTRIARGWTGRRSAYFAIVGFLFILFTYLGVSYLLPGLHSYA